MIEDLAHVVASALTKPRTKQELSLLLSKHLDSAQAIQGRDRWWILGKALERARNLGLIYCEGKDPRSKKWAKK